MKKRFFYNCQQEYKYSDTSSLPVRRCIAVSKLLRSSFFFYFILFLYRSFLCRWSHQSNPFRKNTCMNNLNLHFQNYKSPERLLEKPGMANKVCSVLWPWRKPGQHSLARRSSSPLQILRLLLPRQKTNKRIFLRQSLVSLISQRSNDNSPGR